MKISEIQELIKFVAKSGVSEVEIEDKDFKLTIKTPPYSRGGKKEVEQVVQPTVVQAIPSQIPQQIISQPVAQPITAQPQPTAAAPDEQQKKEDTSKYVEIKSPMIGTFYRRPSPDKDVFVNVGDMVKEDTVVCIIEAMKLFNEIEAEVSGKIVKVLVEDGSPVEYDQPLFLVEPS